MDVRVHMKSNTLVPELSS